MKPDERDRKSERKMSELAIAFADLRIEMEMEAVNRMVLKQ